MTAQWGVVLGMSRPHWLLGQRGVQSAPFPLWSASSPSALVCVGCERLGRELKRPSELQEWRGGDRWPCFQGFPV